MTDINKQFRSAFDQCLEKTQGKELDTIECFEQYCLDQVPDPVEQQECFAQAKTIERCHTCSELKLEQLQERKGILGPEITSRICEECSAEFSGYTPPVDSFSDFLSSIKIADGSILTRADIDTNKCHDIATCTTLDLGNKMILSLPESIGQFKQLQELYLYINALSSLPASLEGLEKLEYLVLDHNIFVSLPDVVTKLKNLKTLYIYSNNLSSLPDSFSDLEELETLSLSKNNFVSLPDVISKLKNLKKLWIHSNNLTSLPDSLGDLEKLELLIMTNNKLSSLPKSLKKLKNLKIISTSANPLPRKLMKEYGDKHKTQKFLQKL